MIQIGSLAYRHITSPSAFCGQNNPVRCEPQREKTEALRGCHLPRSARGLGVKVGVWSRIFLFVSPALCGVGCKSGNLEHCQSDASGVLLLTARSVAGGQTVMLHSMACEYVGHLDQATLVVTGSTHSKTPVLC